MEVKLVVIGGKNHGREIPIAKEEFLIGRAEGCHLRPACDRVSRKHCAIRLQEGRATIIDLNSTNHTFINNEQVAGEQELKNGDRLKVGILEFEVQLSVSVGGKKKPKVHSVQEAAVRTAQTTATKEEDLDISNWINGEEESSKPASPIDDLSIKETRTIGHKLSDTTTVFAPHIGGEEKKEEKKKPPKGTGRSDYTKKVSDGNSQSTASNALRQFLNRKKPS